MLVLHTQKHVTFTSNITLITGDYWVLEIIH